MAEGIVMFDRPRAHRDGLPEARIDASLRKLLPDLDAPEDAVLPLVARDLVFA
ncbi:hypothetical protein [Breoghania sp.]|uniref:hypothetical protein n=1 Tax=Breoghania sp. TaxID=2065378 RepID=UPI00262B1EFF|nr:hypothetical protein [Breoghania sp.]MDJ0932180.1 hypothetical protein [Breoghania sp.]